MYIIMVRKYFTYEAWLVLEDMLKQRKEKMIWVAVVAFMTFTQSHPSYVIVV